MKRLVMSLSAAAAAMVVSAAALACGACVEDKVAATYDHAVIAQAKAKHQQVLFVAVDGERAASAARRITAAAATVRGVEARTLRTSLSPGAFSIAIARSESPERAVAAFRDALRDPAVQLTLVRVMRDGTLIEPK
jgi:hypothetical protein